MFLMIVEMISPPNACIEHVLREYRPHVPGKGFPTSLPNNAGRPAPRRHTINRDLTKGSVTKSMLLFAIPMILGDLLQQCYNIADTLIVGQFLGRNALAAVGSSFTLMTFLTSILLGLCMGSGTLFSIRFARRDETNLCEDICASFYSIAAATVFLNVIAYLCLDALRVFLSVPDEVWGGYAHLPVCHLHGHSRDFPVQFLFLCFFPAVGGKFRGSAGISGRFRRGEHRSGSVIRHWDKAGRRGRCGGDGDRPVPFPASALRAVYALLRCPQVHSIRRLRSLRWARIGEIL